MKDLKRGKPTTTPLEKKIDEVLREYFTGEQYDELHGTFIRIPFDKQMDKATKKLLQLLTETLEAVVPEDRDWDSAAAGFDLGWSAAIDQMTTNMAKQVGKK